MTDHRCGKVGTRTRAGALEEVRVRVENVLCRRGVIEVRSVTRLARARISIDSQLA